jgi:hypothetical protein
MRVRQTIGDAVLTAGGAMVLVLALVTFDDRVRDQITAVFDARHPSDAIAGIGGRITEIVAILAQAMRSQSIEHAPLVIFALAATVLVLFMLRS